MTTASRPTWCPAKGTELDADTAPSLYYSAKDQLAHKNLKLRQPGQHSIEEVKAKKLRLEDDKETSSKLMVLSSMAKTYDEDADEVELHAYDSQKAFGDECKEGYGSSGQIQESDGENTSQATSITDVDEKCGEIPRSDNEVEEDEEEDDDTELLLLELEKIKRERMEGKKQLSEAEDSAIMSSNPLRFQEKNSTTLVSWTEDTVFRNQAVAETKPKKRFINDMGRSDFHRKFMEKYIR